MTFPDRLRQLRKESHLNLYQLANKAKIGRNTVCEYECGHVEPGAYALCQMADALGCSVDYLLGRTDKK
jgi:transcriptional regulator with XRE-family HTH domain